MALNDNVDISGLWLNVHVRLFLCVEVYVHMTNDSPKTPKAVTYDMISLSAMKINNL